MFARIALAAASIAVAVLPAEAQKKGKLVAGSPAPALTIEKWVKGSPVPALAKGKVYVIEFWATWCGPCIVSMPHLSALQKEYADEGVTVIGVTSADTRGNTLERVEKMVTDKGDGMAYTVAWDVERTTYDAFMSAANQSGIPCSFLIDREGRVAWIGHPSWLDLPLAEVVAGTWDIQKGPAKVTEAIGKRNEIAQLAKTDPKAALALFNEFETSFPSYAASLENWKFGLALQSGDSATVSSTGAKIVDKATLAKDVDTLNAVAWSIVDPEVKLEPRDLDLALRAAEKAVALSGEKSPSTLDTLARVYSWKGDFQKAVELQEKAIALAAEADKARLRMVLEEYKSKAM
jgi:thiol-disulfide isomerase/thioredoxin